MKRALRTENGKVNKSFIGSVVFYSDEEIVVEREMDLGENEAMSFSLFPETECYQGKNEISLSSIGENDPVEILYSLDGNEPVAERINVLRYISRIIKEEDKGCRSRSKRLVDSHYKIDSLLKPFRKEGKKTVRN